MPLQTPSNLYGYSKYIVDSNTANVGYRTIQAAITQANADGGGTVVIRPGTYTENLTFFDKIELEAAIGSEFTGQVVIVGHHTPPVSGTIALRNIQLSDATHIFTSAAAGTTKIYCINCLFDVTNGFTFDLLNWTGSIVCDACSSGGTNDGFIDNTGGALVIVTNSDIGRGSGQISVISGTTTYTNVTNTCPIHFVTGASFYITGSELLNTVTCLNNSTGTFERTTFFTGASIALTQSSSGALIISNCIINSSASTVITGAGAGAILIGEITYLGNTAIAGTLTKSYTTRVETGELKLSDSTNGILTATNGVVSGGGSSSGYPYSVGPTGVGAFTTIQAAINAANAAGGGLVIIYPKGSTYSENLTLYSNVFLQGASEFADYVSITGQHTPPASGNIEFQNLEFITSANDSVLSDAVSGASTVSFQFFKCQFNVNNGYVVNITNWNSGGAKFIECNDISTANGIAATITASGPGGPAIVIKDSTLGVATAVLPPGATSTLQTKSILTITDSTINCYVYANGAGSFFNAYYSTFNHQVSIVDGENGFFYHCNILEPAFQASISLNRGGTDGIVYLLDCVLNSALGLAVSSNSGTGFFIYDNLIFLSTMSIPAGISQTKFDTYTPSFSTYLLATATNVTGNGTLYTIKCDGILYDKFSNYDAATGAFTAPVTGDYYFAAATKLGNLSSITDETFTLVITGLSAGTYELNYQDFPGGPINVKASGSICVPMQAGDTAQIKIIANGEISDRDSVIGGTSPFTTYFTGYLIDD